MDDPVQIEVRGINPAPWWSSPSAASAQTCLGAFLVLGLAANAR